MLSYIWPLALVVLSNICYQLCAKSVPAEMNPFASLTITYLVGAVFSIVMYFLLDKDANLLREISHMNAAPFVLGLSVVGLEFGFICAYKAGWQVNTAAIVQASFLAMALIIIGFLVYHEAITWNKLVGVAACIIGVIFINLK